MEKRGEIILYQPDSEVRLEVRLENETVWLSIEEMSQLFGRDISVIGKHIRNVFKEGELLKEAVWAKFAYFGQNLPILLPTAKHIKWIIIILMLSSLWATG